MTTTPPRIDPRLGAAALRAPAVSKEDSCPQAILKFRPPSSLDYKARHGPQTTYTFTLCYTLLKKFILLRKLPKVQN